jgi:hypothetical protein
MSQPKSRTSAARVPDTIMLDRGDEFYCEFSRFTVAVSGLCADAVV